MEIRIQCLCIDTVDPARIAGFWQSTQVSIGQGDVSWVVMADPDGNEFDVLRPLEPDELPPGHDALDRRSTARP